MYVASVPDKISGAGVIAYQHFMNQAAERLGGNFFVLPSSIHEIILVKKVKAILDITAIHKSMEQIMEKGSATDKAFRGTEDVETNAFDVLDYDVRKVFDGFFTRLSVTLLGIIFLLCLLATFINRDILLHDKDLTFTYMIY